MAHTKHHCPATLKPVTVALLTSLASMAMATPPAPTALPTGGSVAAGNATISQSGANLSVNQTTNRGIINWNTFNIGSQATVNFNQPSASAVTLRHL